MKKLSDVINQSIVELMDLLKSKHPIDTEKVESILYGISNDCRNMDLTFLSSYILERTENLLFIIEYNEDDDDIENLDVSDEDVSFLYLVSLAGYAFEMKLISNFLQKTESKKEFL